MQKRQNQTHPTKLCFLIFKPTHAAQSVQFGGGLCAHVTGTHGVIWF